MKILKKWWKIFGTFITVLKVTDLDYFETDSSSDNLIFIFDSVNWFLFTYCFLVPYIFVTLDLRNSTTATQVYETEGGTWDILYTFK